MPSVRPNRGDLLQEITVAVINRMRLVRILCERNITLWQRSTLGRKRYDKAIGALISYDGGLLTRRQYQFVSSVFHYRLDILEFLTTSSGSKLLEFIDPRPRFPHENWTVGLAIDWKWTSNSPWTDRPDMIDISVMDTRGDFVTARCDKVRILSTRVPGVLNVAL